MSLRERKKQQSRSSILAAANALVNRLGYRQTRMRDIATAANISYQTLYNYFPTKALIVQNLLLQDLETLDAQIDALLAHYYRNAHRNAHRNALSLLNQMIKINIDVISHRDRELWREVTLEIISQTTSMRDLYTATDAKAHQQIFKALNLIQQHHELDPYVDIDVLAHTLYVVVDYAILQYLVRPTLSKVALLQELRKQVALIVSPYLR